MRKIAAFLADCHGNHKLGLLHPDTTLEQIGPHGETLAKQVELTAVQKWLYYEVFQPALLQLQKLASGDPIAAFLVGDLTQGGKYPDELVSTRMADQVVIATEIGGDILDISAVQSLRIALGTPAHNYGEGSTEILAAKMLAQEYPRKDVKAVAHGLADVGGVLVDYAHHGPSAGSHLMVRGNAFRTYCRDVVLRELGRHQRPPDVIVRAHVHDYLRITDVIAANGVEHEVVGILLPPLCGMGEHGRQASRSKHMLTVGVIALEIDGPGRVQVHRFTQTEDLRTRETL